MAEQTKSLNLKNIILLSYVGICLLMVVITMGLLFTDSTTLTTEPTPTISPTRSYDVMTLQAEGYDDDEHHGQGQGQGRNAGSHATVEPTLTP